VINCGHKDDVTKEYFANYLMHMSDVSFHMRTNSMEVHQKNAKPGRSPW
jgi:glucose-1-phosphate cytidylyltransferase